VNRKKELRIARALDPFFIPLEHRFCRWNMELNHLQIAYLVGIGPSARHITPATLAGRVARLPPIVSVTSAVEVRINAIPLEEYM
jgi:23S rRNA (guanine745-N1)-methyltransferase